MESADGLWRPPPLVEVEPPDNTPWRPPSLEEAPQPTVEQLLEQRDAELDVVIANHNSTAASITQSYDKSLQDSDKSTAPGLFRDVQRQVSEGLQDGSVLVGQHIDTAAQGAYALLSEEAKTFFNGPLAHTIHIYGLHGPKPNKDVTAARLSDDDALGIRVVLDAAILDDVREIVKRHGIEHPYVKGYLEGATDDSARNAMKVALDVEIAKTVDRLGRTYGTHPHIDSSIERASSPIVGAAIRRTTDGYILPRLQDLIGRFDTTHPSVSMYLKGASTARARDLMAAITGAPIPPDQSRQQTQSAYQQSSHQQQPRRGERVPPHQSPDDFLRSLLGSLLGVQIGEQRPSRPLPPRLAQAQRLKQGVLDEEAVLQKRNSELPERKRLQGRGSIDWFEQLPLERIARVVDHVRSVRQEAADRGSEVPDKTIRHRQHRVLQGLGVELTNNPPTNPETLKKLEARIEEERLTAQIIDVLISKDGRLPF